jgi:Zn-dependent protease with chaperone function
MNAESEAKAILKLADNNLKGALEIAERQLNTIYTRAQVLLSLAGMVVTVTGFSGRLIAGSSSVAQAFLVAGLFVSLSSAIWVFLRVMGVRWVTVFLDEDADYALQETIIRRDRKTKSYQIGGIILCIGLILYCISIALMLLDPVAIQGPVR